MVFISTIPRKHGFGQLVCAILFLIFSPGILDAQPLDSVKYIGHRGARGVFPENSIPGFQLALAKGADMLELDLAVTKDKQVVLSHDPVIPEGLCAHSENVDVGEEGRTIYQMTYEELQAFRCGGAGHPKFPDQEKTAVEIPLLSAVIDSCLAYTEASGLPKPRFDVELKFSEKEEGAHYPKRDEYVSLVLDVIREKGVESRCVLTSFDLGIVQTIHRISPETKVGWIIANFKGVKGNVKQLGFVPDYFVVYHRLASKKMVQDAREHGIGIMVWTVNSPKRVEKLRKKGVTSIISDYPGVIE